MSTVLAEIETTVGEAVERVGPAVVGIGRGWHPASGVIVGDGLILTAAHAVRREEVTVTGGDGRELHARVAGVDEDLGLAALSADTSGIAPVDWTERPEPAIGRAVVALANPGGRGLRATLGFVSAYDRSFRGPRGRRVAGCIEHTAPLPRGSAGGPLVDPAGRLLGLNAVRMSGGLILAIPADEALHARAEALGRGEPVRSPRLGVAVAPAHVGRRLRRAVGLPDEIGVLVRRVDESSAAGKAGVRRGDLIVTAAGRPVEGVDSLYEALDEVGPAGVLELEVVRGTDREKLTVSFDESQTEVKR
jgi:serine protease Do